MNNRKTTIYHCRKIITNPNVHRFARAFERCPYTPTAKDIMYNFYKSEGMDVEYSEIFDDSETTEPKFTNMENSETEVYKSIKGTNDPEVIEFAKFLEECPYAPTENEMMYNFYTSIGMDVEYDEVFAE
ncbi:MAG: hypothetical protein IJQ68_03795 [Methanobrevibacter sp.]|uniref:hypothetical protein n=1 Tax=Methanobrevibacter sp. TaxID=66852 RepID=UPI0025FBD2EF|nr:hypothetical protein [Methanobrevibacter sp.]MBR0271101.1 hypothetical protein [Methanobrevibacter sp.]